MSYKIRLIFVATELLLVLVAANAALINNVLFILGRY